MEENCIVIEKNSLSDLHKKFFLFDDFCGLRY